MVRYALGTSGIALVDMYTLNWAAESYGLVLGGVWDARINWFAADGVVEDEYFGGASARFVNTYSSCLDMRIYSRFLENIFNFGIVDTLDVFIVQKVFLLTVMFENLESGGVQGIFIF